MNAQLGKGLIIVGGVLLIVGALLLLSSKAPWLRLGRLPGDLRWGNGAVRVYFPLMTSLLLSLLLSVLFWLLRK
jgi:hypothetical protein